MHQNTLIFVLMFVSVDENATTSTFLVRTTADLTVAIPKNTFRDGEAIPITCTISNQTTVPITISVSGIWPNHRIFVVDSTGHELHRTAVGDLAAAAFDNPSRDKNKPMKLAGSASQQTISKLNQLDLTTYFEIPKGRFRVFIWYREHQPPTPLDLISKGVEFMVE